MSKQRVLVTGADGFIGRAVIQALLENQFHAVAFVRSKTTVLPQLVKQYQYHDIASDQDILNQLEPFDYMIHTAARAHIMDDDTSDALAAFRRVNVTGTLNLAKQAAEAGVKRFVFISSIKVNGESTEPGKPFLETDSFIPSDPYGLSKYEAEKGLLALSEKTGMEVVIIRPPLVYGPGVKANFASMLKWVHKGIPMPFGSIKNKRSFIAIDNLVSFIIYCIDHPKAANEVFLISDGEDVSTTEILKKVADSLGKKPMLFPVPVSLMGLFARLVGKESLSERLFGTLQVDSSKACDLLGWKPVTTMDEQLKKTADAYLNETSI